MERVLLCTGLACAGVDSLFQGQQRLADAATRHSVSAWKIEFEDHLMLTRRRVLGYSALAPAVLRGVAFCRPQPHRRRPRFASRLSATPTTTDPICKP